MDAQPLNYDYLARVEARGLYANFSITLVEIGIHLFMALYGLSVFLETPKPLREGRRIYIFLSFLITFLTAFTGSLDMAWIFQQVFGASSGLDFIANVNTNMRVWERHASVALTAALIFVGDALLVYRCYIMWMSHWWVTVAPALACLGSLALSIVLASGRIGGDGGKQAEIPYEAARTFLTVSTNIIVTALISGYLLHARRSLSKVLPSGDLKLYTGVVAILIESAAPLTVFGIVYAALSVSQPPETGERAIVGFLSAYYMFSALFYSFCSLSPQMIIFRVTTGRSFLKLPGAESGGGGSIQFAHRTAESSFLQSSANQQLGRNEGLSKVEGEESENV